MRSETKMSWGTAQVDDFKPTWKHYKAVVDQARILYGKHIKPVVHPLDRLDDTGMGNLNFTDKEESLTRSLLFSSETINIGRIASYPG